MKIPEKVVEILGNCRGQQLYFNCMRTGREYQAEIANCRYDNWHIWFDFVWGAVKLHSSEENWEFHDPWYLDPGMKQLSLDIAEFLEVKYVNNRRWVVNTASNSIFLPNETYMKLKYEDFCYRWVPK
jgi:hypothetical protein